MKKLRNTWEYIKEDEQRDMQVPQHQQSSNSGVNALAWVVLVIILLFLFGVIGCQIEVKPAQAAITTVTTTAAATGPKELKGFYLGESRAKIEYTLGTGRVGDSFTACVTELCNKMAFYEFVFYPGVTLQYRNDRVLVIDTANSKEGTYRGISIGDKIPLGKCHRMKMWEGDIKVMKSCVHVYRGMTYSPHYFTWSGGTKTISYIFTVNKGRVTNIQLGFR